MLGPSCLGIILHNSLVLTVICSWADVRKEMTEEKGLDPEVADKIGEWVVLKGQKDLLEKLRSNEQLAANQSMKKAWMISSLCSPTWRPSTH